MFEEPYFGQYTDEKNELVEQLRNILKPATLSSDAEYQFRDKLNQFIKQVHTHAWRAGYDEGYGDAAYD